VVLIFLFSWYFRASPASRALSSRLKRFSIKNLVDKLFTMAAPTHRGVFSEVIELLAVWRHNKPKTKKQGHEMWASHGGDSDGR